MKVVLGKELSTYNDNRYVIVDSETNEIIDDAQGYGYKTPRNAHAAYAYKNRDKSKDAEKEAKKRVVLKWCKENKEFVNVLLDDAFQIAKGSYGPDDKFDAKYVADAFKDAGFKDLPFTTSEFLKYW